MQSIPRTLYTNMGTGCGKDKAVVLANVFYSRPCFRVSHASTARRQYIGRYCQLPCPLPLVKILTKQDPEAPLTTNFPAREVAEQGVAFHMHAWLFQCAKRTEHMDREIGN